LIYAKKKTKILKIGIDECSVNNGGCDLNAICSNTNGTISCACKPGFLGNGLNCTGMIASFFFDSTFK